MSNPTRRTVSDNFTAVRLIAAMAVVLSHSYPLIGHPHEPIFMNRTLGNFAVQCFFVISGYLVSGSWIRSPGLNFVVRRAARLAPALIVSHAFALLAAAYYDNYAGQPLAGAIHGSLWTISWEILMYIGVVMFGTFWLLTPSVIGSAYLFGLLLIIINMKSASNGATVIAPLVLLFVCGAFLQLEKRIQIPMIGPVAIAVLVLLFAPGLSNYGLSLLQWWQFGFSWDVSVGEVRYFVYLLAMPVAVIYVCAFAPFSIPVHRDYSYGVFVFAWPIQQICVHYFVAWGLPAEPLLLFAIAATLSLFVAIPLWHYVERPISKWRYRQGAVLVPPEAAKV
ncbi:acyltransferase [Mesorhizobium salmacidum]|uniref:Acyltransferase n=1 Tax=Mesorhizobium salmacidum TaxID=3015171 RepID=A0ABU8L511_9HYPH